MKKASIASGLFLIFAALSIIGGFYMGGNSPMAREIFYISGIVSAAFLVGLSLLSGAVAELSEQISKIKIPTILPMPEPSKTIIRETIDDNKWTCTCGVKVRNSKTCPACGLARD